MSSKRSNGSKISKGMKKVILTLSVLGVMSVTFATGAYASTLYNEWGGSADYNALVGTLSSIGIKGESLKEDLRLSKLEEGALTLSETELKAKLIQADIDREAALTISNIAKAEALALSKTASASALAALEISKAEALAVLEGEKAILTRDNAALDAELLASNKEGSENKSELDQAEVDMKDANTEASKVLADLNK